MSERSRMKQKHRAAVTVARSLANDATAITLAILQGGAAAIERRQNMTRFEIAHDAWRAIVGYKAIERNARQ